MVDYLRRKKKPEETVTTASKVDQQIAAAQRAGMTRLNPNEVPTNRVQPQVARPLPAEETVTVGNPRMYGGNPTPPPVAQNTPRGVIGDGRLTAADVQRTLNRTAPQAPRNGVIQRPAGVTPPVQPDLTPEEMWALAPPERRTVKMSPEGMITDEQRKANMLRNVKDFTPTFELGGSNTVTGQRNQGIGARAGQNGFTINRQSPYGDLDQYTPQTISVLANQKRAQLNQRRMAGGAAEGGSVLRQVKSIYDQAAKAEMDAMSRGMNVRAAKNIGDALRGKADALLEYDDNMIARDRNRISADSNTVARERIAADTEYRNQAIEQGYAELGATAQAAGIKDMNSMVDSIVGDTAEGYLPRGIDEEERGSYVAKIKEYIYSQGRFRPGMTRDQISREVTRASAVGSFLTKLGDTAGFRYSSLEDLLSMGIQTQDGKQLPVNDVDFWKAVVGVGPLDAAWADLTGDTQIILPGTNKLMLMSDLQNEFRNFDRGMMQRIFERVDRGASYNEVRKNPPKSNYDLRRDANERLTDEELLPDYRLRKY